MGDEEADAATTVRVAVRVRPMSQKEFNEGGEECVEVAKDGQSLVLTDAQGPHSYAFDNCFGTNSTQPEVFQKLGMPLLDKSFEGYNATIFAYGQTGSGKTHTMMSDRKSDDRGLIPRISENLFERITNLTSDSRKFLVQCSFLEIYNEIVYDLLVPRGKSTPKTGLEIREQKGLGVYVKDLQEIVVDSSEKLQKLIDQGFEHRATASTNMNATSSRSHCLFIVKIHQKDDSNAANNNFSKMNLVDLAGSERASRTGAQGDTLKEGANINKSLSSLGNVINALSKMASGGKKVFIPYRDSKLTRVLQESLGGNALTTMMAALSPSKTNSDETLSTLNYAKRAKTIKVNASKNEEAEQLAKLEQEVEVLRAKLAEQASGVADTSKYQNQIDEMEKYLKQTWEDKEVASKQHEEERKALAAEAQKLQEQAQAASHRRLKLLEEKGDIELSIQELRASSTVDSDILDCTAKWPDATKKLISLQQKISAQCRAVGLCKEAVVQDVAHWAQHEKAADDTGGAASRMLLSQAAKKATKMLKEFEALDKLERDLEISIAGILPNVRRTQSLLQKFLEESKAAATAEEETKDEKSEKSEKKKNEGMDEFGEILSLVCRQLDAHRLKVWTQVAKDHKPLGKLGDGVRGMLECLTALGVDTAGLAQELELEASGAAAAGPLGSEASASLARPLGLADGELPDSAITASSNQDAAACARLLSGPEVGAFGGWCPARDAGDEYLQVDFGAPKWICGMGIQGRQPAPGGWEQTRALVAKVLEPDPLPPKKIFQRPPVRFLHDVIAAAHTRHQAFEGGGGADFQASQLDYKQMQKFERQAKVEFFDLVVAKTNGALRAAGIPEDEAPNLAITPDEILRGKNTGESNRMLQLISYLSVRRKSKGAGGLVACGDQWVTKYRLYWSANGKDWAASMVGEEPVVLEGSPDAVQVCYTRLGDGRPQEPVRYLRVYPAEWVRHPGFRVEVFGWGEGDEAKAQDVNGRECRLDVARSKANLLKVALEQASIAATERWKGAQKAMEDERQQARGEKEQVELQLQDATREVDELRKSQAMLEERSAENEQKLIDADTEKLKLEVDRDRLEAESKDLEEKLNSAKESLSEEKVKVQDLEAKAEESKATMEDQQQQIGVLTEERDCARAKEEELYDTLCAREEELMNTNDGYVYLTEHLHEVREELEEKVDQRDRVIETLNERNQELQTEGITLRQQMGELRRQLQEAEKAVQRAEQGLPVKFGATEKKEASPPRPKSKEQKKKKGGSGDESEYEEDFDDE